MACHPGRLSISPAAKVETQSGWLSGGGGSLRWTSLPWACTRLGSWRRRRDVAVDWVLADLLDYQPPANAYELALIAYLQIAADERAAVLRNACSALAAGGEILVIGHDLANLSEGIGGPQEPGVLYTPEVIAAELPGLSVQRAERVRRPVEVDGVVHDAIDTLVRATRP